MKRYLLFVVGSFLILTALAFTFIPSSASLPGGPVAVATWPVYLPHMFRPPAAATAPPQLTATALDPGTATATVPASATPPAGPPFEGFEGAEEGWKVVRDTSGSGTVARSNQQAVEGSYSARISTESNNSTAQVRLAFQDAAQAHTWMERPGTYRWQRVRLYVPAATIQALGTSGFLDLAGFWPSAGGSHGWWLRVRQGGQLSVFGYTAGSKAVEFPIFASLPMDRWMDLELGLHTQAGPGVKRAFAFVLDGSFYGWYHQGNMANEVYDRSAAGILGTNSTASLIIYADRWENPTSASLPGGLDYRPSTSLASMDYRQVNGANWQIDWSTWENSLVLSPGFGLHSNAIRLQSGFNQERMPDLTSGWAEIEIDWPKGKPPANTTIYFGPMVGFRKEINREENLEVIPLWGSDGQASLAFEAWVNGGPQIKAQWPLPVAATAGAGRIPEPGDIIRVRWEAAGAADLRVRASYYDASAGQWFVDVINHLLNVTNVGGVNFNDGYHRTSSITIDSPYYSIRRYQAGTLETFPSP